MSRWTDTTAFPNLNAPAPEDLLPIADMSEAVGTRQRTITWAQLEALAAAGATVDTVDPTATDDTAAGYSVGSIWFNATDGGLFVATDVTASAAVWAEFTGGGGGSGDVIGPASAVDERIAVFDGTTGKLIKDGGATIAELAAIPVSVNAQTGTTYTLVLGDAGKLVTLDNGAAITLTVPTNASVAFPVGTVVACAQLGAGLVSIAGATGVTINGATPGAEASAGQWSTWSLTKLATDTWLASGGLA